MSNVLQMNIITMYFLYGLSFYTMGVAIALQYRSYSSFRLAHSFSLLAIFGLLHGLSEWGSVFIPAHVPYLGLFPAWKLVAIQRLLHATSYFFLFCFGVKLISDYRNHNYWWYLLPVIAYLGWLLEFGRFFFLLDTFQLMPWLLISDTWADYVLALPAGLFTAYGLILQIQEVKKIGDRSVIRNVWLASFSFILFAILSGLVVPQNIGWLSSIINVENFRKTIGMPVELFRTVTALIVTRSVTRILSIFDLEYRRRITDSRRLEAVYQERERFARDLHDDVIQSIYGEGLELQTAVHLLDKDVGTARIRITDTIGRLNRIIQVTRAYIQGLEADIRHHDFCSLLEVTIAQFREKSSLKIDYNCQLGAGNYMHPVIEVGNWQQQIRQIIREALYNIMHHAQATEALIEVKIEQECLVIMIQDNGRGLPTGVAAISEKVRRHLGLRNMQARAKMLGGDLHLSSQRGEGVNLKIIIPVLYEEAV